VYEKIIKIYMILFVSLNLGHIRTDGSTDQLSWIANKQLPSFPQSNTTNPIIEPRHDKTNIVGLRPAWIQTSLRIRAV
jgi:hypothetical protein